MARPLGLGEQSTSQYGYNVYRGLIVMQNYRIQIHCYYSSRVQPKSRIIENPYGRRSYFRRNSGRSTLDTTGGVELGSTVVGDGSEDVAIELNSEDGDSVLLSSSPGWFSGSASSVLDDSCCIRAESCSNSSLSCSTLASSQRAMSNGSNICEEDTSHQHRSARRMTAGSGAAIGDERSESRMVANVTFVAQALDTVDVNGTGCQ